VSFFADGKWTEVLAGGSVYMPKQVPHTFKNTGDRPSNMLVRTSPAGFESFFARCAAEFQKSSTPDMKRVVEIAVEHGIHFVGM
jgi:hypothetical protein